MSARTEVIGSRENLNTTRYIDGQTPQASDTSNFPEASAVSWGAILAGAAAAAAMSLILLILGTGLGLSAVSPWVLDGIRAEAFTVASILWLAFASLTAAGTGGYLAGRLRTRWLAVDPDEVYFRDTAHGFLTWAVATLVTAALLTSVIAGIVGTGMHASAAAGTNVLAAGLEDIASMDIGKTESGERQYVLDLLFRRNPDSGGGNEATQPQAAVIAETSRIVTNALTLDSIPRDDLRYGALLVARHTGISEQAAAQRLAEADAGMRRALLAAETAARQMADTARRASAITALWLFVTLLGGAFVASFAATFGGRQRDQF